MRFYPKEYVYTPGQAAELDAQYATARTFGKVKLGKDVIFWRGTLRWYALPFERVLRVYRRQDHVYGKLCAGGQNYDVHLLMLVLDDGTPVELHIGDDREMKLEAEQLYAAIQEDHPNLQYGKA